MENIECWLATDSKGQKMMNAHLTLKKDIPKLINRYSFMLYMKNKTEPYLTADIDICQGLGTSFTNPVTRMVSEEIHRISNYPYDCPLKKVIILRGIFLYI